MFVRAGNPRISAAAGTARGHVSSGTRVLNILMGCRDILAYYSAAMVTHTCCFAPILIAISSIHFWSSGTLDKNNHYDLI